MLLLFVIYYQNSETASLSNFLSGQLDKKVYNYQLQTSELDEKLKQQTLLAQQPNIVTLKCSNIPHSVENLTKPLPQNSLKLSPPNASISHIFQENNFANPWIIIVFSNIDFVPITEIWHRQMSDLGYNNTRIYALDQATYQYFSQNNDTTGQPYRIFYPAHNATDLLDHDPEKDDEIDPKTARKKKAKHIWEIRLKTCAKLIHDNYNILLTDVDSIWTRYYELSNLPVFIDGFYGTGVNLPHSVFKAWHFVLHGGMFAFHSNPRTNLFWKVMAEKCKRCDDQILVNRVMKNVYGIRKWETIPGSTIRIGYGTNSQIDEKELQKKFQLEIQKESEDEEDEQENKEEEAQGKRKEKEIRSNRTPEEYKILDQIQQRVENLEIKQNPHALKIMIFSKNQVIRGRKLECGKEKWVLSPNSGNTVFTKLRSFDAYKNCFSKESRNMIKILMKKFNCTAETCHP